MQHVRFFASLLVVGSITLGCGRADPADGGQATPLGSAGSLATARDSQPASGLEVSRRHVVINDQQLTDEQLAQLEQAYGIRIADADYWYDPVLGAWGAMGGPTQGFIAAGLPLGGALRPDASGGGTQVFVNGREIHPNDLLALQQLTGPIAPGRYFITNQGLAGYEGGAPIINLAALAAQSRGAGGSNTWQSSLTGASGFSDGTTGAVFFKDGGFSSVGQ